MRSSSLVKKIEKIDGFLNHILIEPIKMTAVKEIVSIRSDNKIGIRIDSPEGKKGGFISLGEAIRLVPEISSIAGEIL